jgi:hypothetical protein
MHVEVGAGFQIFCIIDYFKTMYGSILSFVWIGSHPQSDLAFLGRGPM